MQSTFFPIKLIMEEPNTGGGADLACIGYTANKIKYAVKRMSDHQLLPLTEWIGYKLCELVGILTPDYGVLECLDGSLAFGSRWEDDCNQIYNFEPAFKINFVIENAPEMSRTFALDIFYGNDDRHFGNFISTKRAGEDALLAMDFSRAGPAISKPFGHDKLPDECKTEMSMNYLKNNGSRSVFDDVKFTECKTAIEKLTKADMGIILDSAPVEWFNGVSKDDILNWWDTEFKTRIKEIK